MELTRTDKHDTLSFTLDVANENNINLLESLERGRKLRISREGDWIVGTIADVNLLTMTVTLSNAEWTYKTVIEDGSIIDYVQLNSD